MKEISTFRFLWKMVNELERHNWSEGASGPGNNMGTIISRYASMLDDRLENSGYSRSTDSLALYSTRQLKEELEERKDEAS